jgi:hypothetical protein
MRFIANSRNLNGLFAVALTVLGSFAMAQIHDPEAVCEAATGGSIRPVGEFYDKATAGLIMSSNLRDFSERVARDGKAGITWVHVAYGGKLSGALSIGSTISGVYTVDTPSKTAKPRDWLNLPFGPERAGKALVSAFEGEITEIRDARFKIEGQSEERSYKIVKIQTKQPVATVKIFRELQPDGSLQVVRAAEVRSKVLMLPVFDSGDETLTEDFKRADSKDIVSIYGFRHMNILTAFVKVPK